jgi:ketosteroid isomerase-like protein
VTELAVAAVVLLTLATGWAAYRGGSDSPPNATSSAPAAIQAGTAASTPTSLAAVPSPAECRVEPRPLAAVLALFATPGATPAHRVVDGTVVYPPDLPAGFPADAATVAAVTAVWREFYACVNAGDFLRQAALVSEDGIRLRYAHADVQGLALAVAGDGTPVPADRQAFARPLYEVRVLEDGRVGALIDVGDPAAPEYEGRNHVIFVEEGGRWLIDEVVTIIG